jgi:hypothetical protein
VSIGAARFESRADKSTGTARANRFSFNRHFHKGRQRPAVRLRRLAGTSWGRRKYLDMSKLREVGSPAAGVQEAPMAG